MFLTLSISSLETSSPENTFIKSFAVISPFPSLSKKLKANFNESSVKKIDLSIAALTNSSYSKYKSLFISIFLNISATSSFNLSLLYNSLNPLYNSY